MAGVKYLTGTLEQYNALAKKDATSFYLVTTGAGATDFDLYLGTKKLDNQADITAAIAALTANDIEYQAAVPESGSSGDPGYVPATGAVSVKDALDALYEALGSGGGVEAQIDAKIQALDAIRANYTIGTGGADDSNVQADGLKIKVEEVDGKITSVTGSIVPNTYDTYGAAETAKNEVIGTGTGKDTSGSEVVYDDTITGVKAEIADLAGVAKSGAAADVSVADTGNKFSSQTKTVENILAEIMDQIGGTDAASKVSIVSKTGSDVSDPTNYAEHIFYQGLTADDNTDAKKELKKIGSINIAKEMVATDGELAYPSVAEPITINGDTVTSGVYIKMTIANGTPFYINVADLIEYNTFTNEAPNNLSGVVEEIYVTDSSHTITLSIGEIAASKIVYHEATEASGEEGEPGYVPATSKETVSQAIARIDNAIGSGSIDSAIDAKIGELDTSADIPVASKDTSTNVVTISGGIKEVDGIVSKGTGTDVALAPVAATGAGADVSIADTGNYFVGTNVEAVLQEIGDLLTWQTIV